MMRASCRFMARSVRSRSRLRRVKTGARAVRGTGGGLLLGIEAAKGVVRGVVAVVVVRLVLPRAAGVRKEIWSILWWAVGR